MVSQFICFFFSIQKFLRVLLAKTFNAFGVEEVEGEQHYHKHIRNIAINWACQAHLEACIKQTRDKFEDFMLGERVGFPNDHETSLLCNGILTATEDEFDFIRNLFKTNTEASRRSLYLSSMACIENEEILTKLIMMTLEGEEIDNTNNEWLIIIEAVYSNGPIGLRVALKFLRENYDDFIEL